MSIVLQVRFLLLSPVSLVRLDCISLLHLGQLTPPWHFCGPQLRHAAGRGRDTKQARCLSLCGFSGGTPSPVLAIRSHPETWDVVELSLELNFDRTLGQLERGQRMLLGQRPCPNSKCPISVSRIMRGREKEGGQGNSSCPSTRKITRRQRY